MKSKLMDAVAIARVTYGLLGTLGRHAAGCALLIAAPVLASPQLPGARPAPIAPAPIAQAAVNDPAAILTVRYVLLVDGGKQAGEQIVERHPDGLIKVHYVFKNNGRGPELDEQMRVAPDGTLSEYHVTGSSTFGARVDEHFTLAGNQAQWHSTSENGARPIAAPSLYVPINGSLEPASIAVNAMLKRPGGKLGLLPSGSMSQRKVDELVATRNGMTQRVQLVAQTGIGFGPVFYWQTIAPQPRLFAYIVPGAMTAIEDGWQSNEKLLATRQKLAETRLLTELATRLQRPLTGLTVVRNARVFDSEKAQLGAPSDVYILRGKIAAVVPAGSTAQGADFEIDAAGRVMLPGLFDMHAHLARWDGGLHLAAGVTTVRDMGNDNTELQQMMDETLAGKLFAPQIVPAGFLEGESPHSAANGFLIHDLAGAKNAVDWYAQHGYPQLKIYNSFPHALLKETAAYAHQRGMRVSGHVPAFLRAEQAVEQGFDEIQHINQLMLNFLVTPETDTRTLARFYLPAEKVAGLDFNGKPVQDFIAFLKQRGTVIDPTLATFAFLKQRDGEVNEPFAAVADHLPPDVRRGLQAASMKIPDAATAQRYKASYDKMVQFTGMLYRAGVPLVAGTDDLAGFTLQAELALYVKAGLSPAQALQIATWNGATYTRTLSERGSITAGKLADLLLVDGDPTADIANLRKVALVITRGKLIYPHEVDVNLGITPFVQNPPQLRAVPKAAIATRQ